MNDTQKVNEALTNQPKCVTINGKTLLIYSHSPRRMVLIDGLTDKLIELSQQGYQPEETGKTLDTLSSEEREILNSIISQFPVDTLTDIVLQYTSRQIRGFESNQFKEYAELGVEALYHIINLDTKHPEVDKDWIWDNISIQGEGSPGEQIINAYNEQKSPLPFLGALARARSLA